MEGREERKTKQKQTQRGSRKPDITLYVFSGTTLRKNLDRGLLDQVLAERDLEQ